MKNLLFSLLFSFPLIAFGQFGLEVGYSSFYSDLGFEAVDAESLGGFYGQANFKTGDFVINLGADINATSETSSGITATTAVVILRVGMQYSIALGDSFSINPGFKLGSYGIGYSIDGTTLAEGHIGLALGVNAVYMFTEHIGVNIGIDNNILFEGEWDDGDPVEGFSGLSIRPGLKFYF